MLLPSSTFLRRFDTAAVILTALLEWAAAELTRKQVAIRAGVPFETCRSWWRRWREVCEAVRQAFTSLAHIWNAEQPELHPQGAAERDALHALGHAVQAARARFQEAPAMTVAQWASALSRGRLLCNASSQLVLNEVVLDPP